MFRMKRSRKDYVLVPLPERANREGDQPLPEKNDREYIQDLVIADIEERKKLGIKRYGSLIQAYNGRDVFRDLYEEQLDALMYTKQLYEEQKVADSAWMAVYLNANWQMIYEGMDDDEREYAAACILRAFKEAHIPMRDSHIRPWAY
jgi:hypothetical protein